MRTIPAGTFSRQLFMLLIPFFLVGCQKTDSAITSLKTMEKGKTVAVPTGTVADQFVLKRLPDAKVIYFNSVLDCALAVLEGKADAAAYDQPILKNIASKYEGLTVLEELLIDDQYGFAVRLDDQLLKKAIDETLSELKNNGVYEEMSKRWFPDKGELGPMPLFENANTEGTLRFGTAAVTEPMSFYNHNHEVVGFDIEFAARIAQKLGKQLEIVDMEFGALLPSLISGKIDMVGAGMSITEERAKKVLFSECYYPSGIALLVKNSVEKTISKIQKDSKELDISKKKIGVLMGSVYDSYANKTYPEATIFQYQNIPDMLTALTSKKVDVAFFEDACLNEILKSNSKIDVLKKNLFTVPIGAGFNKENSQLRLKYNEFLKEIRSNGQYKDICSRWIEAGIKEKAPIKGSNENGTLTVGLSSDLGFPYVGVKDGQTVGFEIELAERFAAYLGKQLIISDMPFGSLIAALSTKKIDMVHSSMMITEERMKQIDFSDPYFESGGTIIGLKEKQQTQAPLLTKLEDIADKRIGILSGTVFDKYLSVHFPQAKVFMYDVTTDMILALQMGKVDAIFMDVISAGVVMKKNPDFAILSKEVESKPLGIGFNKKNKDLRDSFNYFLNEIKSNGIYDEAYKRWFTNDPEKAVMPGFTFPKEGKKLVAGVAVADLPYVAYMNEQYVGFDIELLKRFAEKQGYQLEFLTLEFSSLIAALHAGKVDMITDGIAITAERSKLIDFSDPYAYFQTAVLTTKRNMPGFDQEQPIKEKPSFLKSVGNSFYSNIILENRYLLIVNGLKVTLLISILSALFGTLVGSIICYFRMSRKRISSVSARLFIDLIRGTPVLVLLMIIFYVIFASVNINPVIVAVIAFGINFGAYVSEMFRSSIESIEKGQWEAGIASGFSRVQTFLYIIMPQALQRVLPVYKDEFISLVKMTSIVGYIAVQDLTKASDIIRSRTFDAFFPLIMAAVIYIAIAALLTWGLSYIEISVDPKRRKIRKTREANL